MKKQEDFSKLSDTEIQKEVIATREKLRQFRFSQVTTRTKNVKEGSLLKKRIARLLTTTNKPKNA